MSDRYFCMGQVFITNGAVITVAEAGRIATAGNTTLNLSTTGGAGTFTITMASGASGTVTSGTATITGSVVTLAAGANTITSNGAGTCTLALTLGTAANWNTVNSWSATSGGAVTASVPTSADNVYFNANSFTAGSQVLTVDASANCKVMDWTGATNTPTLTGTGQDIIPHGNTIFVTGMTITGTLRLNFWVSGTCNFTSAGRTGFAIIVINNSNITLLDDLNIGSTKTIQLYCNSGAVTLNTNGQTVTCGIFYAGENTEAKTLTLGASTINCTSWQYTGSNLTVTANTSTINVSGTGAFAGGAITTYNIVNLNGSAHTLSGSNTFNTLAFKPTGNQTITFTDGTTQTFANLHRTGNGKITFQGSSTGGWAITQSNSRKIILDNMSVSYSTALPAGVWFARIPSTNGGNNSGWTFNYPTRSSGWFALHHHK